MWRLDDWEAGDIDSLDWGSVEVISPFISRSVIFLSEQTNSTAVRSSASSQPNYCISSSHFCKGCAYILFKDLEILVGWRFRYPRPFFTKIRVIWQCCSKLPFSCYPLLLAHLIAFLLSLNWATCPTKSIWPNSEHIMTGFCLFSFLNTD